VANVAVMALHLQTVTIPAQIHSFKYTVILDVTDINTEEYYLLLHFYDIDNKYFHFPALCHSLQISLMHITADLFGSRSTCSMFQYLP